MLKKGPLWAIYTASYFIDYILILGIMMWRKLSDVRSLRELFKSITARNWITGTVLLALIIFSIITIAGIKKIRMTTRIKFEPEDDVVWEAYSGFLAPTLALAGTFFGDYGLIFSFVIFIATGIAFVRSKQVHLASVFLLPMGYKIFKSENDAILITKDTRDELRLRIAENPDGVEAKELELGIFLVK